MNGDNLQSNITSILKGGKIPPLDPNVSNRPLDVLHGQTEQGAIQRNGIPQSMPTTETPQAQTPVQMPVEAPIAQVKPSSNLPETIASLSGIKNVITNTTLNNVSTNTPSATASTASISSNTPTPISLDLSGSVAVNTDTVQNPTTPSTDSGKAFLQKPIRTYESDVAELMSHKRTSVAKMVIAEKKKETGTESISNKEPSSQPSNLGKNLLKIIISLILIGAGGAGGYYLYLKSPLATQPIVKPENKIASVIAPDTQKLITVNSLKKQDFTSLISNEFTKNDVSSGKIVEIVPVQIKKSGTATSTKTATTNSNEKITTAQFLTSLDFDMTDTLKRSLTDKWMLGVYSADGEKIPFIVLTNNFFQNSYAGMLKWEATMPDEFATLLNYKDKAYAVNPLSTSTISSYFSIKGKFTDKIIKNRDIREFVDGNGEVLLLYSFLDKDTIVISTSELIISTLVDRIEKQNYIR